uniref:Putative ubiquitin activating domain contining protein n=1 Tax=viral metagenome TaxID=1070528 RepID=A0A6M3IQ24_9ZZZZ
MEKELYSRQKLLNLYTDIDVHVFGVGGIGFWVALQVAMTGIPQLSLWDNDTLEESNRARLPFPQSVNNMPKTEIAQQFINTLRPDLDIICYGKATELSLSVIPITNDTIAFDCTDNSRAQQIIARWARQHNFAYIKAGYDGLSLSVTSKTSSWSTQEEETIGYTTTPSWVVPAIMAASIALTKAFVNKDLEVHGNIGTILLREEM